MLSKLYNGRDKTFFFGSYEKINQVQQSSYISSSLTPAERSGDFSAIESLNAENQCTGICVADPTTEKYYPNNQIPSTELATPAAKISQELLSYMTLPNLPGYQNNIQEYFPNDLSISQSLDRLEECKSHRADDTWRLAGQCDRDLTDG